MVWRRDQEPEQRDQVLQLEEESELDFKTRRELESVFGPSLFL